MRVILKLGSNFNQRNFDRIDWKIATSYGVDIDPSTISLLYCGVMKWLRWLYIILNINMRTCIHKDHRQRTDMINNLGVTYKKNEGGWAKEKKWRHIFDSLKMMSKIGIVNKRFVHRFKLQYFEKYDLLSEYSCCFSGLQNARKLIYKAEFQF